MRPFLFRWGPVAVAVAAVSLAIPASVAEQGAGKIPIISSRSYISGTAKVIVTGSFQVNADIALNTQASFSDGEMTWLQYGVSGSAAPNSLITVSPSEIGVSASRGKQIAVASADGCTGSMTVVGVTITGHYTCKGLTSYEPGVGMGKVDIDVRFTARS